MDVVKREYEGTKLGLLALIVPMVPAMIAILVGGALIFGSEVRVVRIVGLAVAAVPFLTMEISLLKRFLLAILLLELTFPIDIYLGHDIDPDQLRVLTMLNPGHANTIAGYNISITTLCLIALYSLWFIEYLAQRQPRLEASRILPALVYVTLVALSGLTAVHVNFAFYEIAIVGQALLVLTYLVHALRDRTSLFFVLTIVMMALVLQAGLVIGQATVGLSIQVGPLQSSTWGNRMAGTLGSPNGLGSYLGLLLAPALGLTLARARASYRLLGGAALALGATALYLTGSRGAWAGSALSVGIVLWFAYRHRWVSRRALLTATGIGLLFMGVFLAGPIAERFATGATAQGRVDLMEIAWSMIGGNPIFGVGANNFAAAIDPYVTVDFSRSWISTVHNKYLLVWAETGILALLAFIWLLGFSMFRAWTVGRFNEPELSPVAVGLAAGIAASMVHMMVEMFHSRPQTHLLWMVLGLAIGIEAIHRRELKSGEDRGA